MLKIDLRDIRQLEKDLTVLSRRAMPYATRQTLTATAWKARTFGQQEIEKQFTIRSKTFLPRGVAMTPARGLVIASQESAVGHLRDAGALLEKGQTELGSSVPLPGSSGEPPGVWPRKRIVRRGNRWNRVNPVRQRGSGKQAKAIAIRKAAKRSGNQKTVVLKNSRGSNLFRLMGRKGKEQLKLLQTMPNRPVRTPAQPWLKPAVHKAARRMPIEYVKALRYQISRHRIKFLWLKGTF